MQSYFSVTSEINLRESGRLCRCYGSTRDAREHRRCSREETRDQWSAEALRFHGADHLHGGKPNAAANRVDQNALSRPKPSLDPKRVVRSDKSFGNGSSFCPTEPRGYLGHRTLVYDYVLGLGATAN